MNCGILSRLLAMNPEAGEVVPTYKTLSLHDMHCSGTMHDIGGKKGQRLGVVDLLFFGYQSSRTFQYEFSETDASREVAGYG